jgi:ribonucleoside-diphosphate reductase alpha chain
MAHDYTDENRRIAEQRRDEARGGGYTGDACGNCGNFRMRRSGTCLACDTCGQTTGCS